MLGTEVYLGGAVINTTTKKSTRKHCTSRGKFLVLLSLLGALLAWRAGKVARNNNNLILRTGEHQQGQELVRVPTRATVTYAKDNRKSAFTVTRGVSSEAAAAARRAETVRAAAAEVSLRMDESLKVPGLGEGGEPAYLEGTESLLAERVMEVEAFNRMLSDRISLDRDLRDVRHPLCRREWDSVVEAALPTASVVIVFHNEPRSTLLRTVHSVVKRSPPALLREVILVDDFSDREELGFELDYYLDTRFGGLARRLKLPRRWGLTRARLVGAHAAKGDVLVFLDAHCEVTNQWLQPLLEHVGADRRSIAVPVIDLLDATTLEYEPRADDIMGGFTWDGHFDWLPVPESEKLRRSSPVNATRTPVMAGGLFAINREYFWEVGAYDEYMDLWGGENLEMSFRVWMCGGSLMTIPCSRVGHIFRKFSPYSIPRDSHGYNTARLAHVWMDDYKRVFFLNRPDLMDMRLGDLTSRKELRQRLQCNSFQWYLENVYPGKLVTDENVLAYGKVRPRIDDGAVCLERLQWNRYTFALGVSFCNDDPKNQIFALTLRGELRWNEDCAEVVKVPSTTVDTAPLNSSSNNHSMVVLTSCDLEVTPSHQQWEFTAHAQIRHRDSGLCLEAQELSRAAQVIVTPCRIIKNQTWSFENSYILNRRYSQRTDNVRIDPVTLNYA